MENHYEVILENELDVRVLDDSFYLELLEWLLIQQNQS